MNDLSLARVIRVALACVLVDLAAIVISGGWSLVGRVSGEGFTLRLALALALLVADFWSRGRRGEALASYGYVAVLLLLVPILHFRGYRLRGDGLWYYSYSHSIAFDGDVDLSNQYRSLGIEHQAGSLTVRETGRARFTYPVGAPLFWVPFVELGHLGVWLRNRQGVPTAYDGFSDPYFHAVALANLLFGWMGMIVCHRFLRKWFPPWAAFVAVTVTVTGSFLAWYMTYHAIYTHALTFLLVSLFVKRWSDGAKTTFDYAVLGLVLGLAGVVRWQNLVFGALPALDLLPRLWRREWRPVLAAGAALAATTFLGLLPQLVTWKIIYDRFYVGVPLGAGYLRFADPFLTETLFSSRHGLFSWSPVLLVATVGLFLFVRSEPRRGLPLLAVSIVIWYVDSTVADWWGGGSFGGRRFDSVLPALALGLGAIVVLVSDFVARHPRIVTGALMGGFVVGNGLLMEQYRKGRIPVDDTISWETALGGELEDVFDAVGYPFSFPMNWMFSLRYHRPKTQYDILVGKYLFDRMGGIGGVIDLGPNDPPFLGNGWSGLRDWNAREREVRFAMGGVAGLFVPVDERESLRIAIECASPPGIEPQPVEVRLNGIHLAAFLPKPEMSVQVMVAEAPLWRRLNLLELVRLTEGGEGPFIAVDRLRFERLPR